MGDLLHSMRDHQPLPSWAPPPAAPSVIYSKPAPVLPAPPASQQIGVTLHGALFFVTYSTDEDGAWVDLIQAGGLWWEIEQIHRQEWIDGLNDALCALLLAEAADEVQP